MISPVKNTIPTLRQLAACQIVTNELKGPNQDINIRAFEPIKGAWDDSKGDICKVFGPNSIMQNIEKSFISEYCKEYKVLSVNLSPADKEDLLTTNATRLFETLINTLNVPVNFYAWTSSLQKMEEESLMILWNKGICPQLEKMTSKPFDATPLNQIKYLDLPECGIKAIPPAIENLKSLVGFCLSKNEIRYIPEFLGCLLNLRCLELGQNHITWIPDAITNCKKMNFLLLGHNKITNIPSGITNLTELEELDLDSNNISYIPSELLSLQQLYKLSVAFNPLFLHFNEREPTFQGLHVGHQGGFFSGRPAGVRAVQAFLSKVHTLNTYECQGQYSQFIRFTLDAFSNDCHFSIKTAFNDLGPQDKDLICEAYCLLKQFHGEFKDLYEKDILFEDMDTYCRATIKAIWLRYEHISDLLKEWGQDNLPESLSVLLLSDIMEDWTARQNDK